VRKNEQRYRKDNHDKSKVFPHYFEFFYQFKPDNYAYRRADYRGNAVHSDCSAENLKRREHKNNSLNGKSRQYNNTASHRADCRLFVFKFS
jgi:hypothetical protein